MEIEPWTNLFECCVGDPARRKEREGTHCDRLATREWKGREGKGGCNTLNPGGLATVLYDGQAIFNKLLGVWHSSLVIDPTKSSRSDDDLILISPNERRGCYSKYVLRAAVKVIHHPWAARGGRTMLINGLNNEWLMW